MAYLVQLLLPTTDNDGRAFSPEIFVQTRTEIVERFGGVTTYLRAPAHGLWKDETERVEGDDIVIFEVMSDNLDRTWWAEYRARLAGRFRQDELVIRALRMDRL